MRLNGKSEVELREPGHLETTGTAGQPFMEPLVSEPLTCDICGQRMSERHCKIICPNCGYTRDCSDP